MQLFLFTGLPVERLLARSVTCLLFMLVLTHLCLSAPGLPGAQREDTLDVLPPSTMLANPFGSGEEERRLLQSYIQVHLKAQEGGPKISSWEQEVFFLFSLYDYDRSGHMDGLELMKLLSDYNSYNRAQTNEPVVSMVDFLLQTQDLNQDGLLGPSELLSPPLPQTQGSNINSPSQQKQEVALEDNQVNAISETDEGGHKEREVTDGDVEEQTHKERQARQLQQVPAEQEQHTQEEKPIHEIEAQHEHRPEAHASEQAVEQEAPVHQGQPEM